MLGIALTSETFQRLLFNLDSKPSNQKTIASTVFASLKSQTSKKNNIVIICNGVQQNQNRSRKKRYVYSEEENSQQSSEIVSHTHQKKHLIKKQKKEDPDYSVKRQKNDRNVISNIIHHLMKHASSSISEQQLLSIFTKKHIDLSISKFQQVLSQKEQMCKTYITNKHLKLLWDDFHLPQFCKAMRIISRIFLQNYSFLTIFNGNKLNRQSKAIHYKGRRDLVQFLSKIK